MSATRFPRRLRTAWTIVAITGCMVAGPASATTIRVATLEEIAAAADRIVQARVLDVRSEHDEHGVPCTYVDLEVVDRLKGNVGARFTIKQLGMTDQAALLHIPGLPRYHRGDEAILFLHADSPAGFTSPVGMAQGYFPVVRKGDKTYIETTYGRSIAERAAHPYSPPTSRGTARPLLVPGTPSLVALEDFRAVVDELITP